MCIIMGNRKNASEKGNGMELNQDTIKKIRGLILFTIAAVVAGINYRVLLSGAFSLLRMLSPFLMGAAIAFVLNVPMRWIEEQLRKKCPARFCRPLSLTITIVAVFALLSAVMTVVLPEIFRTLLTLQSSVPAFLAHVEREVEQWFTRYPELVPYMNQIEIDWEQLMQSVVGFLSSGMGSLLNTTVSAAKTIVSGVTAFSIAFVFALYILLQKETLGRQMRKLAGACLPEPVYRSLLRMLKLAQTIFSSFLAGQCVEAVILGLMFFVTLTVFQMPYAVLIGVLIAFTALIPVFGAFIGCAVGAFLILMVSPMQSLAFICIFLVLQQIEGNLIYPHVVGNSVGLPSIWVLAAVTLGGSMMGITGMLVFIPLVSVLYALIRGWVYQRLKERNLDIQ